MSDLFLRKPVSKECVRLLTTYQSFTDFFYSIILKSTVSKHLLGWESVKTQTIRFKVLLERCPKFFKITDTFSILDAGCGYGKLYAYMLENNIHWQYTGLDLIKECIEEAKLLYYKTPSTRHTPYVKPRFILGNILEPNLHVTWGTYDISFMSGVLNLNIDKMLYVGANYELTLFVIQKLLLHSRQGCVCNFLHTRESLQDDTFFYHDPQKLCNYLKKYNIIVKEIYEDYLSNDFTFVIEKK